MTRANAKPMPTIEELIQSEIQTRLDRHVRLLKQSYRIEVLGLHCRDAMFVVDVASTDPKTPDEVVRVLAAAVENEMQEEHPGLRLILMPDDRPARIPKTNGSVGRKPAASSKRFSSRKKGR